MRDNLSSFLTLVTSPFLKTLPFGFTVTMISRLYNSSFSLALNPGLSRRFYPVPSFHVMLYCTRILPGWARSSPGPQVPPPLVALPRHLQVIPGSFLTHMPVLCADTAIEQGEPSLLETHEAWSQPSPTANPRWHKVRSTGTMPKVTTAT